MGVWGPRFGLRAEQYNRGSLKQRSVLNRAKVRLELGFISHTHTHTLWHSPANTKNWMAKIKRHTGQEES